ncbi:unnamed protein product [Acanthoscelides obtectus]|uniref:Uncharacterized protein n=1 Tax=Acanthoscelides obtectus TaxID=200917 RepID=A0A9P0LML2_ACAOB|nr:unnamed protein product [Acanthoscelides obtectus]CAK1626604.1 hypothetical protein AOBTE_LOCUS3972 [Acanthoscelides obtectus]
MRPESTYFESRNYTIFLKRTSHLGECNTNFTKRALKT